LDPDHPHRLENMTALGLDHADRGQHGEALKHFQKALDLQKAKLGPNDLGTMNTMTLIADSYAALGQYAESIARYKETLSLQEKILGPEHPVTLGSKFNF